MNDGGGCGQQSVIRQEIYFRDDREHSPEYPGVYLHIRAGLLRSIIQNPSARGISVIQYRTPPSGPDAPGCCWYGALRTAGTRPCEPPVRGLGIGELPGLQPYADRLRV